MHQQTSSPEQDFEHERSAPYFVVDDVASNEDRALLNQIEVVVTKNPNFAQESFDAYMEDPEVTERLVGFLEKHPEGLAVLSLWKHVVNKKLDLMTPLDPQTESEIENDPYYKSVRKEFQSTKEETLRVKMRKQRIKIMIRRASQAEAA